MAMPGGYGTLTTALDDAQRVSSIESIFNPLFRKKKRRVPYSKGMLHAVKMSASMGISQWMEMERLQDNSGSAEGHRTLPGASVPSFSASHSLARSFGIEKSLDSRELRIGMRHNEGPVFPSAIFHGKHDRELEVAVRAVQLACILTQRTQERILRNEEKAGFKMDRSLVTVAEGKEKSNARRGTRQKEPVVENKEEEEEEELYDWPRLICCFGEAMNEFVPTVCVSNKRQHPDKYSTWKMLQWMPPEFARILGGPSFNTAIALARQGCRVALMGKVGDDEYGQELVYTLNINRVQTRGVRFDPRGKTGISELSLSFENGEAKMSCVKPSAENSFLEAEINADILKEATMFHFTSSTLTAEPNRSSLFSALTMYKVSGGDVFYDVNLPLPLWISRENTWHVIEDAWLEANFIEVTKHELEFLLGEKNIKKNVPQYAISDDEPRPLRDEYHYTPAEVAPLWHKDLKMLFVTDGTYVIHYYALDFNGKVLGVEDVIVAAYTCDRAGSADAMVAGIIKKLNLQPELYKDKETLPKALRYAMSAGVIAQWTPGSTKGLPTESAAQNLTEQIYHPVFVQSIGTELYSTVKRDYML